MKKFQRALFIFRRDLRLEDNKGLLFALKQAKEVIPCFIFTPEQIEHNPYFSNAGFQFMIESLEDLQDSLEKKGAKLHLFYGSPEKIVEECIEKLTIDAVIVNQDYTPYSLGRDQKIQKITQKHCISFHSFQDLLLHPVEDTLKSDGKPYTIFTPFYKNASKIAVEAPMKNSYHNYYTGSIAFSKKSSFYDTLLPKRPFPKQGGRKNCLQILKSLKDFSDYSISRDFPITPTTRLSPHLKFTTCSPREIYQSIIENLGPSSDLIRSLYWRDFFTSIAFHFPKVFSGAFHSQFNNLPWNLDEKLFKAWCEGKTGFPIVDAGMQELNTTGFMHNRVRMIVSSFLIKDLHINWQWGEKYFAQKLVDYDPCVNNGNWQWAASTGCDAQPYFRIFNPWLQAKKFDPDCEYIKQWIPELISFAPNIIHNWHLKRPVDSSYPIPIIDHTKESKKSLSDYKRIALTK